MQSNSRLFTVFLASITALTSLSIDMSLPAVPAIEQAFGQPASHGSLTLSLFLAGYAITPLAGGPLADRFGRRPVLMAGLGLFALSALACTLAPAFGLLLFFRLLQGCASGLSVAMPLAIVRDRLASHEARQKISEVTTVNGLMPLLAPVLGSWVMLLGGWRVIFATQAIFAVGVVSMVTLYFDESLPRDRRQPLDPPSLARNYWLLLTNRGFMGYSLMYAMLFVAIFTYIAQSPLLLMERMGVARGMYTLLFALSAIGTILGALASSVLSRRRVAVRAILTGGTLVLAADCVAAAALQIAGFHRPWALVPLVFVMLFCFGLLSPAVTLEALETVPHLAGSGSGVLRSLQMLIGSAGSGFMATFCARRDAQPEIAVTLGMAVAALAGLGIYFVFLRGNAVKEIDLTEGGEELI